MRTMGAGILALIALALLGTGIPPTLTALATRRAVVSSCDASLGALSRGTRVRLIGCGTDMFHASFSTMPLGRGPIVSRLCAGQGTPRRSRAGWRSPSPQDWRATRTSPEGRRARMPPTRRSPISV